MLLNEIFSIKKLTSTEKQITEVIEANPRAVLNLSLTELSEKCYSSEASIIRLCKKLGCDGYADFKIKLAQQIGNVATGNKKIEVDIPISKGDSLQDIAQTMSALYLQTIRTTQNNLDFNMLKRASFLLAKADLVHVYGRGESLILAEDFHYKLLRIGKSSTLEPLNGFEEARCLDTSNKINQAALIVSHYCNSRHIHYIIDELMSASIPFVLLTASPDAFPYDRFATATLRIVSTESRYKMGSFASRCAIQYVLDCLYCEIFELGYDSNMERLTKFSKRKQERSYFYSPNPGSND